MRGVSVVICCYNSGKKLPATLRHLAKQVAVPGAAFEVVIVDNNCTDDTVAVARNSWAELQKPFPMKIIKETKAGLNFARITGIQNAQCEYVVLCDDDNWLCEDYLFKAYHHFESKKEVALLGGVGVAEFETSPPAWFHAIQGFGYAVGNEGRQTGYVASLYGAGMALRRSVFLQLVTENSLLLSDRNGGQLSSGGDTEICGLAAKAGHRIYLDCSMTFRHFLTKNRLTWPYYLRLRKSFGVATAHLQQSDAAVKSIGNTGQGSVTRQFLSLLKYCFRNWKYTLFPLLIKTSRCANFVQQKSMRLALLRTRNN